MLLAAAALIVFPLVGLQAEPPSQVVVYDASGSMYRSDTGEYRYRLAQKVVARLAEAMREHNITTPTGMVVFGRQYFQGLHVCQDIEVPVRVPSAGAPNSLAQIVAEAERTKPNGQTPLLDAMIKAAEQMPPQGGMVTVITDLDEETCGGDPCDIAARLQAIGRPLGSVVNVGFVVATGLQAQTNGQAVQRFSNCVGGNLRFVDTLARAEQVADEIATSLAAWRPGGNALTQPPALSNPGQFPRGRRYGLCAVPRHHDLA
jgi:Ca-activated chloride channel family protein